MVKTEGEENYVKKMKSGVEFSSVKFEIPNRNSNKNVQWVLDTQSRIQIAETSLK